jgi:nucleotide-binding universal stress UspA family protein
MRRTIICPVDFSEGSESALDYAAGLARMLGNDLELVHVFQVPAVALPDGAFVASPTYLANLTSRAQQELETSRARVADDGLHVTTVLLQGMPASSIVDHADPERASMIVMGTHGKTGLRRLLLGSVAEQVVRSSRVPVLTVRNPPPPERSARPAALHAE